MTISVRPVLRSGLVAATATAITFAAVATPLPEVRAERAPVPTALCVELAATSRPLAPKPDLSALAALSPTQVLEAARVVQAGQALTGAVPNPNLVTTPGLINLANFIDNLYLAIEPWVAYAFEWVAYAVSWIPYIGWIIDDQIYVVYNFVESLIHSGVFNVTDWMRGQGSFAKNLADWVVDLGLSLVWLALDEISVWGPLPPINYPPRAPWADLPEGQFGDAIVGISEALARVSNGIWNIWEPIKGGITSGVDWISGILDRFARIPFVPLINFELTEAWVLIAKGGDALTGFAHDMINAGNTFIFDTVKGDGLIAATETAFNTTVASIRARLGQSVQAFADWGQAQIDFLVGLVTPGSALVAPSGARVAASKAAASDVEKPTAADDLGDSPAAAVDSTMSVTVADPEVAVAQETVAPEKPRTSRTTEVVAEDVVEEESEEVGSELEDEPTGDEPPADDADEPGAAEPESEVDVDADKPDVDADKDDTDKGDTDKGDADPDKADAPAKASAGPTE